MRNFTELMESIDRGLRHEKKKKEFGRFHLRCFFLKTLMDDLN